jgi:hypothetical protein
MRNDKLSRDHLSDRLLRVLAQRLNARGIETHELKYRNEVIEIAAINPRDRDRSGRVMVGDDGYLVWESWTEFNSDSDAVSAAEIVHALLTGNGGQPAGSEGARALRAEKSAP